MNEDILNVEQAIDFLGVSEKTLIKLLREEHIPARKIGREWRFSKEALIQWLSTGDSKNYINDKDIYEISIDLANTSSNILDNFNEYINILKEKNNIKEILKNLNKDISIPDNVTLRINYRQQRDVEKLEFKLFWPLRDEYKINIDKENNSI